jgi:hypothetical protein
MLPVHLHVINKKSYEYYVDQVQQSLDTDSKSRPFGNEAGFLSSLPYSLDREVMMKVKKLRKNKSNKG